MLRVQWKDFWILLRWFRWTWLDRTNFVLWVVSSSHLIWLVSWFPWQKTRYRSYLPRLIGRLSHLQRIDQELKELCLLYATFILRLIVEHEYQLHLILLSSRADFMIRRDYWKWQVEILFRYWRWGWFGRLLLLNFVEYWEEIFMIRLRLLEWQGFRIFISFRLGLICIFLSLLTHIQDHLVEN